MTLSENTEVNIEVGGHDIELYFTTNLIGLDKKIDKKLLSSSQKEVNLGRWDGIHQATVLKIDIPQMATYKFSGKDEKTNNGQYTRDVGAISGPIYVAFYTQDTNNGRTGDKKGDLCMAISIDKEGRSDFFERFGNVTQNK